MTLDEAVDFLSTPRSTMYRWLREGKVPGHKLGRQWRFLRSELEAFRAGGRKGENERAALAPLAQLITSTDNPNQDYPMDTNNPSQLAENLVWHAVDTGASVIHLGPSGGEYELLFRTEGELMPTLQLTTEAFDALDREWMARSRPVRGESKRRLFLERDHEGEHERIQVRYRKLPTFAGERVTLSLLRETRFPASIDVIAPLREDAATLERWSNAPRGLVLVAGRSGSGKTTTAYCCLSSIAKKGGRAIFTIEDEIGMYLPGVDQVEVDLADERASREAFSAILESDLDVLFVSSMVAQRHRAVLWGMALAAAESGHLVFVQVEADSAADALATVAAATERPVESQVLGVVWQELLPKKGGGRKARYEFVRGALDGPQDQD